MGKSQGLSKGGGGIMGTGVFGLFGTTIRCDANDESAYCQIMKLFNLLIVIFVVCIFAYYAYNYFVKPALSGKSKK